MKRLMFFFGSNDKKNIDAKLAPYSRFYSHEYYEIVEITNKTFEKIKKDFKISEKEINNVIINDRILHLFLEAIYPQYFHKKEESEAILGDFEEIHYFYKDKLGKYRIFTYEHPRPYILHKKIPENPNVLDGVNPFMIKGETDLNSLKDNKRFSPLATVVDLDGVWHDIECASREETIDKLIKLADNIPDGTNMTVILYDLNKEYKNEKSTRNV